MCKKNAPNRGKRQNFPYSTTSEFERILPYRSKEIEPVLSQLFGENMAEFPSLAEELSETKRYNRYVNEALTRYIIIRNVSAIEYYLRHAASKIVDDKISGGEGIDFSKFFSYDFEAYYAEVHRNRRNRKKKLTKGQAFANQYDFMNPSEINCVFSRLLGKKFFETIWKINPRAGKHPWKCRSRSRGLVKNWKNFMKMFEKRNEIVHSMKHVRLSKEKLCYLCNNTRMFMEQANVLVRGALKGGNAEQDFFHERISDQERLRREELVRSTQPSRQRKK